MVDGGEPGVACLVLALFQSFHVSSCPVSHDRVLTVSFRLFERPHANKSGVIVSADASKV